jgi:hypothetical protein
MASKIIKLVESENRMVVPMGKEERVRQSSNQLE